jgi:rhomboid protease GluP
VTYTTPPTYTAPSPAGPPGIPSAPAPAPPTFLQRIRRFPATFGLIGVTILVFLAQSLAQALVGGDIVLYYGAKINENLAAGEAWRLVTPIFLHANLLHIGVNMYSLWAIGPAVERFFGRARFLTVYLLSGICGVLLSLIMSPSASVGASGAIFGLLGALATFLYLHRPIFGQLGAMQLRQLVFVALINLAIGLTPGIDNWGHVGGLVAGLALAWFLGPHFSTTVLPDGRPRLVDIRTKQQISVRMGLAIVTVTVLSILAMMNAKGT